MLFSEINPWNISFLNKKSFDNKQKISADSVLYIMIVTAAITAGDVTEIKLLIELVLIDGCN